MNIEILVGKKNGEERQDMKIDGTDRLSVLPLNDYPEDAIIGRDLVSCKAVSSFMREAYEAGKRGEDFNVIVIAQSDDTQ